MIKPLVGVVIGSRADFNIVRRGLESLRVMGVPYKFLLASPHRAPDRIVSFAQRAGEEGMEVIVCAAGGAANVAGMLAAYTTLPIIAVPIDSTPLRGQDALLGMVQQPPGLPVATVGINNGENAALLATQILALKYPQYREVLAHHRLSLRQKLEASENELLAAYPDLCDPLKTGAGRPIGPEAEVDTDPGSESDTPEGDEPRLERLQPGAMLVQRIAGSSPAGTSQAAAGQFVRTPQPQEPSAVTEDPEVSADVAAARAAASLRAARAAMPPPPRDADLNPPPAAEPRRAPIAGNDPTPVDFEPEDTQVLQPSIKPQDLDRFLVETKVFRIDHEEPDEDVLSHAMMVLLEGGIVAFPTDTVYGLAVDATNADAVKALYEVKGHDAQRKSLSVLVHSPEMLDSLVKEVPPSIENVIASYWPGGLTILFSKHPDVLNSVSDSPSIAIRIPNDPIPLGLMGMIQKPLAVINASLQSSGPAVDAGKVLERFDGKVHCVLDAGSCRTGEMSTVLSVITEPYEILREGTIPARDLKRILGEKMRD